MRDNPPAVDAKRTALAPLTARLPAEPDPALEANKKRFELGYRRLWPHIVSDDQGEYIRSRVERYAMYRLGNATDAGHAAKDVAQDAFVKLWELWFVDVPPAAFPESDREFDSAVFKAIRACAQKHKRDEGKLKRYIKIALGMEPDKSRRFIARPEKIQRWMFGYPDAHPFFDAVMEASQKLSPRTEQVFQLKWRDGYSYKEIAQRLKISQKTVDWHLQKANADLQQLLADYMTDADANWMVAMKRLAHIDDPNYSPGGPREERGEADVVAPYRIVDFGVVGLRVPRIPDAALIEMHSPMLPDPLQFLSWIIGAVRAWPDMYVVHSRGEELEVTWARVLTPYLAGELDAAMSADIERAMVEFPELVEWAAPLSMAWKLAPAATGDARADVAWAEFQRRVGLSTVAAPRAAVARIERAAALRRDFKVRHPRYRMWWGRIGGLVLVVSGGSLFWRAGMAYIASGRSPSVSGLADGGFFFALGGLSIMQSSRVQVIRRSRALVFALAAVAIALAMDLFSAWSGSRG